MPDYKIKNQQISELVALLEDVSQSDRHLDECIAILTRHPVMGNIKHWLHEECFVHHGNGYIRLEEGGTGSTFEVPQYTASIDAALNLFWRLLPEWCYQLVNDYCGYFRADLAHPTIDGVSGRGDNMAIAVCIAVLKGWDAQTQHDLGDEQ